MAPTRRTLLGTVAGALPVALAGCAGSGGGDTPASTPAASPEPAAPTESPTPEPTATPEPTVTPTATETPGETSPTVRVRSVSGLGSILVGSEGMTLYMFEKDPKGGDESACTGGCASAWPPLTVEGEDGLAATDAVSATLGTIERSDGSLQVAANGWPLYYFASDENPGDAKGQGVNDAWWVLRPDGTVVEPRLQTRSHPEYGEILTDPEGMTLYMFDRDTKGRTSSACSGGCANAWPPFTVEGAPRKAGDVSAKVRTFERESGGTQVTANGWPLYYFASDENPGDAKGQGVNDAWWVLRPDGTPVRSTATPTEDESGYGY